MNTPMNMNMSNQGGFGGMGIPRSMGNLGSTVSPFNPMQAAPYFQPQANILQTPYMGMMQSPQAMLQQLQQMQQQQRMQQQRMQQQRMQPAQQPQQPQQSQQTQQPQHMQPTQQATNTQPAQATNKVRVRNNPFSFGKK